MNACRKENKGREIVEKVLATLKDTADFGSILYLGQIQRAETTSI